MQPKLLIISHNTFENIILYDIMNTINSYDYVFCI